MGPKFSDSSDERLRKSYTASYSPLLCEWESSPSLGINLNHMFLLEQPLFECTRDLLFPRLLNDSSSRAPSNHKTSEALSTQKTGWSSSLPLLPPQVLPSYQVTSTECHIHLNSTALHPIQTPHKTRPHRISAGSPDE